MTTEYMDLFLKEYNGLEDPHMIIFELVGRKYYPEKVLYPASYCHITPSLFYPKIVYVDNFKEIEHFFDDKSIHKYVKSYKLYNVRPKITFHFQDFRDELKEKEESFDLLISLNAESISQECKKFLKKGGILLANDDHYDAREANADDDYQLVAVFDEDMKELDFSNSTLSKCFKTKGLEITPTMISQSKKGSHNDDSFKPDFPFDFYLFEKI